MSPTLSLAVGVVLCRQPLANPWQDACWRAVDLILDAPPITAWREVGRDGDQVRYHAATLPLELHRKETPAYIVNLQSGEPAVYVVLRQAADSAQPVEVHAVSASPHDVQVYGETEGESIITLPMPEPLQRLVEHFVARHHVEEPFIKRKRQRHHTPEIEKFGQEPIFRRSARKPIGQSGGGRHG